MSATRSDGSPRTTARRRQSGMDPGGERGSDSGAVPSSATVRIDAPSGSAAAWRGTPAVTRSGRCHVPFSSCHQPGGIEGFAGAGVDGAVRFFVGIGSRVARSSGSCELGQVPRPVLVLPPARRHRRVRGRWSRWWVRFFVRDRQPRGAEFRQLRARAGAMPRSRLATSQVASKGSKPIRPASTFPPGALAASPALRTRRPGALARTNFRQRLPTSLDPEKCRACPVYLRNGRSDWNAPFIRI